MTPKRKPRVLCHPKHPNSQQVRERDQKLVVYILEDGDVPLSYGSPFESRHVLPRAPRRKGKK